MDKKEKKRKLSQISRPSPSQLRRWATICILLRGAKNRLSVGILSLESSSFSAQKELQKNQLRHGEGNQPASDGEVQLMLCSFSISDFLKIIFCFLFLVIFHADFFFSQSYLFRYILFYFPSFFTFFFFFSTSHFSLYFDFPFSVPVLLFIFFLHFFSPFIFFSFRLLLIYFSVFY